jgi:hypothetical protein
MYRRRRSAAAVGLFAFSLAAWVVLAQGGEWLVRTFGDVPPPPAVPVTLPADSWTVRPGDTLWQIARAMRPTGDVRPVLDGLVETYGSSPLEPGQVLHVPQ